MANVYAPKGFVPRKRLDGAALSFQIVEKQIAYNNAHSFGMGDLVVQLASGYIDYYQPQSPTTNDPATFGIFWGCEYLNPALGYNWWYRSWTAPSLPSTYIVKAFIIAPDDKLLFEGQSNGAPITIADEGANIDIVAAQAPNAQTGYSTGALDQASIETTAQLPFRIWGPAPGIGNGYDTTANYNRVLLKLNSLSIMNTTGVTS